MRSARGQKRRGGPLPDRRRRVNQNGNGSFADTAAAGATLGANGRTPATGPTGAMFAGRGAIAAGRAGAGYMPPAIGATATGRGEAAAGAIWPKPAGTGDNAAIAAKTPAPSRF